MGSYPIFGQPSPHRQIPFVQYVVVGLYTPTLVGLYTPTVVGLYTPTVVGLYTPTLVGLYTPTASPATHTIHISI
jgi:hypothetical protein